MEHCKINITFLLKGLLLTPESGLYKRQVAKKENVIQLHIYFLDK